MPSVQCPKCHADNAYPANEAGNARICVQCGHFIPSQLTGGPTVKGTRSSPIGESSGSSERRTGHVSFGLPRPKSSPTNWVMFGVAVFAVLIVLGASGYWILKSNLPTDLPPIAQSEKPPKFMNELALVREAPDFIVYFTLYDEDNSEIARSGQVQLTISEITHVSVVGTGNFDQENKLYTRAFSVEPSNFTWYSIGGLFGNARRIVCAMRVPSSNLSRHPPPGREGLLTVKFSDGHKAEKWVKMSQKFFF